LARTLEWVNSFSQFDLPNKNQTNLMPMLMCSTHIDGYPSNDFFVKFQILLFTFSV